MNAFTCFLLAFQELHRETRLDQGVIHHRLRGGVSPGPSLALVRRNRLPRVTARRPLFLTAASAVVALQALVLLACAVLVLADIDAGLAGLGVSAAIFFLVCAAALGFCAWGLFGQHSWARAPIVLTQLITLGLAWDARHAATALAVVLAVLAVGALVCVFHPTSLSALDPDGTE